MSKKAVLICIFYVRQQNDYAMINQQSKKLLDLLLAKKKLLQGSEKSLILLCGDQDWVGVKLTFFFRDSASLFLASNSFCCFWESFNY